MFDFGILDEAFYMAFELVDGMNLRNAFVAEVVIERGSAKRVVAVRDVRISLGAVAPTVVRATHAEAVLEGNAPTGDVIARAEMAIQNDDARPITDFRSTATYRRAMCAVLLRRALRRAGAPPRLG